MKAPKSKDSLWSRLDIEQSIDLELILEIFNRQNLSEKVELYAPLEKKSSNTKILAKLKRIEKAIIKKALNEDIF